MALNLLEDDPLLGEAEAAALLARTVRTLRRWRDLREGAPHIRIGRQVFYRRSALRQWLLSREGRAS
jgi:hypothetical protein